MRRFVTIAMMLILGFAGVVTISCEQSPTVPSEIGTVDQLVRSLRGEGLTVSTNGEISPSNNGFFTVPAQELLVDGEHVNGFEYPTAERAAAEAALISSDAQPDPHTRITWVSVPRFYRQGRLIALYVGCSSKILAALEKSLGAPIVTGTTPCR
jgi:hypothetical protein